MQGISASRAGENSESSVICDRDPSSCQLKPWYQPGLMEARTVLVLFVYLFYEVVRTLMACQRFAAVRGAARGGRMVLLGSVCLG